MFRIIGYHILVRICSTIMISKVWRDTCSSRITTQACKVCSRPFPEVFTEEELLRCYRFLIEDTAYFRSACIGYCKGLLSYGAYAVIISYIFSWRSRSIGTGFYMVAIVCTVRGISYLSCPGTIINHGWCYLRSLYRLFYLYRQGFATSSCPCRWIATFYYYFVSTWFQAIKTEFCGIEGHPWQSGRHPIPRSIVYLYIIFISWPYPATGTITSGEVG